jgi:predicted transglutaminase-like cysteine proteinase
MRSTAGTLQRRSEGGPNPASSVSQEKAILARTDQTAGANTRRLIVDVISFFETNHPMLFCSWPGRFAVKLSIALAVLVSSAVLGCAAQPKTTIVEDRRQPNQRPAKSHLKTVAIEKAKPPLGWAEFCVRHAEDCADRQIAARQIALDSDTWNAIVSVNRNVNAYIKPTTDREHWGAINVWHYPDDGRGDCKAYVLLKRRALIEAGFPPYGIADNHRLDS